MLDFKNLNIMAVLVGVVVDVIGSMIAAFVFGLIYGIVLSARGLPPAEIAGLLAHSTPLMAATLIIGLAFVALGGYLAAGVAGGGPVNPFAVGVVATVFGVFALLVAKEHAPFWYNTLAFLLTLPCALLGGKIHDG